MPLPNYMVELQTIINNYKITHNQVKAIISAPTFSKISKGLALREDTASKLKIYIRDEVLKLKPPVDTTGVNNTQIVNLKPVNQTDSIAKHSAVTETPVPPKLEPAPEKPIEVRPINAIIPPVYAPLHVLQEKEKLLRESKPVLPPNPTSVADLVPEFKQPAVNSAMNFNRLLTIGERREPTFVIIDGKYLYESAKSYKYVLDYARLQEFFFTRFNLLRIKYYVAVLDTESHNPLIPTLDWLTHNGYDLYEKLYVEKEFYSEATRVSCEISVDLALMPYNMPHVKHVVIFSGSPGLCYAIQGLKQRGVRVTVIGNMNAGFVNIHPDLKREVDHTFKLEDLRKYIERVMVASK